MNKHFQYSPAEVEAFHHMVDGCVAQEGASEADKNAVLQRVPPTTASGYCLFTCIMENVGVVILFECLTIFF